MRWKFTDVSQEYRCCGCIHVKTGTMIIGAFILILVLVFFSPTILPGAQVSKVVPSDANPVKTTGTHGTVTENSKVTGSETVTPWWMKTQRVDADEFFGTVLFVGACTFVTLMMIYGTIKNYPGFLTPFMGLQVFDFCMSSLTLISYFSYTTDIKQWILHQPPFPYKEKLLAMHSDWLMLMFVLFSVGALCIRVYLIGIVWSCYKYLVQQQRACSTTNTTCPRNFDIEAATPAATEVSIVLPPKYEDVANVRVISNPPPPYSAN